MYEYVRTNELNESYELYEVNDPGQISSRLTPWKSSIKPAIKWAAERARIGSDAFSFSLQSAEHIYHWLCGVSVVMDNLPSSRFTTINVRDANVAGYRLSTERKLHMLDTQFVGQIPSDLNELIA